MSLKGSRTTADYIEFDRAKSVGDKLLNDSKFSRVGLLIIVAINSGLRISDVLNLKWSDISGDVIQLYEKKTGKFREIGINSYIKNALKIIGAENMNHRDFIFVSQKGSVYSRQYLNRILKDVFKKEANRHNVSTHSLRKSFGRRVYVNNNESEKALVYLSEIFNHSSPSVTRKYLGIRKEEIKDIYLNL